MGATPSRSCNPLSIGDSRMVESARGAITDFKFVRVSENQDAHMAALVARTVLAKKVGITLTNSGKKLTNIKIRVRLFGDEVLSFTLLDKLKAGVFASGPGFGWLRLRCGIAMQAGEPDTKALLFHAP